MSGTAVPYLVQFIPGQGVIPAAWCNTVVQGGCYLANLRAFTGIPNQTVQMVGFVSQGDGGQGTFCWSSNEGTDDGGVTTIVPYGVIQGCWIRQTPGGVVSNSGAVSAVSNIATLRTQSTSNDTSSVVFVEGYYNGADGGEGLFWYNSADVTSSDNGGTIIIDASNRRWYRETEGGAVKSVWFGAVGNTTTDDSASMKNAIAWATPLDKTLLLCGTSGAGFGFLSSVFFSCRVDFTLGAVLFPAVNTTVTFGTAIIAFVGQIFGGEGNIVLSSTSGNGAHAEWWGAVPDGVTDNAGAINSAVNSLLTISGGTLIFSSGNYHVASTVTVNGAVILAGQGPNATLLSGGNNDINVLSFGNGASYAGIRDMFIIGDQSGSSVTQNVVTIATSATGGRMCNCNVWGGSSAVYTQGTDWTFDDCFISGFGAACLSSHGANWYKRCKFDTIGSNSPTYSYQQGPYSQNELCENHFDQCDFSGQFGSGSVFIGDQSSTSAITVFTGCVFSSSVNLNTQVYSSFVGCELGSTSFSVNAGTCSVVGCFAFTQFTINNAQKAGNINIS